MANYFDPDAYLAQPSDTAPPRRAGLGEAGLPPGYVLDRAPRNVGLPPGFTVDNQSWPGTPVFDPDEYLQSKNPQDAAFVNLAREWGVGHETPAERFGTDIGKSAVSGIVKGVVGLPGIPGTINEAVGQGLDLATRKSGLLTPDQLVAYNIARTQRHNPLPTSQDVVNAFERNVSGPLYEPQTRAGRYAQTIGEFAPGLIGGPETVVSRLVPRVIAPAVGSEAAGEAAQGTGYEGIASLAGAVAGHGLTNAVRGTNARMASALRPSQAAASAVEPIAEPSVESSSAASEELPVATPRGDLGIRLLQPDVPHDLAPRGRASVGAAAAEASPLAEYSLPTVERAREIFAENGLDNPHMLEQRLEEISPHHTLAELEPGILQEAAGIHAADRGAAKNQIAMTFKQRANEFRDRAAAAVGRVLGRPENLADLRRGIEAERAEQAGPLWFQFVDTPVPPTPALRALQSRLEASGALRAADRAMAIEGLPSRQAFYRRGTNLAGEFADEIEQVPTAATYQRAKEFVDAEVERALAAPGGAKDARMYTKLANDLRNAHRQSS